MKKNSFPRDIQYVKFSLYGALKNLKFFDPFIILFFREMGISFLQIGTLFAIREIDTNILEVPTGIFADSYGKKKAMVAAFLTYIVSFILFAFFPSFWMYSIAMVFFASGEAFRSGTHKALILKYLEIKNLLSYKIDYYGHTRGWAQVGAAVSSVIAALLVFFTGTYRIVFIASIVPYILDMFLILSYPNELDEIEEQKSLEQLKPLKRTASRIQTTIKGFVKTFKNPRTFRAMVNGSLFDSVFETVKDYLQPIIKQFALLIPFFHFLEKDKRTAILIGIVYVILYLLNSIASQHAGKLQNTISQTHRGLNILYFLGTVVIVLCGVLLYFEHYILSIVLFVLYHMLKNIKRPLNVGYFSDLFSSRVMATGLSVESQAKTILMALLAPNLGFFADTYGISIGILSMAGILLILSPFSVLRKPKEMWTIDSK